MLWEAQVKKKEKKGSDVLCGLYYTLAKFGYVGFDVFNLTQSKLDCSQFQLHLRNSCVWW